MYFLSLAIGHHIDHVTPFFFRANITSAVESFMKIQLPRNPFHYLLPKIIQVAIFVIVNIPSAALLQPFENSLTNSSNFSANIMLSYNVLQYFLSCFYVSSFHF